MATRVKIDEGLIQAHVDGGWAEGTIEIEGNRYRFRAEFSGSDRGTNWTINGEHIPVLATSKRFGPDVLTGADEALDEVWMDAAADSGYEDGEHEHFVATFYRGKVMGSHVAPSYSGIDDAE